MSGTKGVIYSYTFQWLCLLAIPAVLLFTACTNNDDDSLPVVSGQETVTYAVTGFVVKGGVAGSTVNVHALGSDGVRGAVLATASTDGNGAFNLADAIPAPAEVVATGGTYKDEATGATVDMTGRELSVILLNGAAAGSTVAVTPLTRIAASQTRLLMIELGADLTTAVNRANEDVTDQFGITGVDITSVPPLDMSASSGGATALTGDIDLNSDAARYGLVILGLSQTALDENRPPEDVLDLVDNIATDMANSVLDEGDALPHGDFPRTPGDTLCKLGVAIDSFLGGAQNSSSVTPDDVDHKTYPNGVDCGGIAAAPAPGFQCTDTHVIKTTAGDGEILVEWRRTDGADWYDLYYAAGANPTVTSPSILNIGGGAITQLVTGLTNGQEYCFGVIANGCSFGQILCDTPNGPVGYNLWWESAILDNNGEKKRTSRAEVMLADPVSGCDVTFTDGGAGDPDGTRNGQIGVCLQTNAPPVIIDTETGCPDCHMGMIDLNNSAFASADIHIFPWYSDPTFGPQFNCGTVFEEVEGRYDVGPGTHTAILWLYVDSCFEDEIIMDYCDANPGNCDDGLPLVPLTDLCGSVTNECTATFVFPEEQALTLWPSGEQGDLDCGVTVTDGGPNDMGPAGDECVDILLNWTEMGSAEYMLYADFTNNGTRWDDFEWYDSGETSGPPFRFCAEDICPGGDGTSCEVTDNYQIDLYDYYDYYAISNECPITFDFPGPQEPETLTLQPEGASGLFSCGVTVVNDDANDMNNGGFSPDGYPIIRINLVWNDLANETGYTYEWASSCGPGAFFSAMITYGPGVTSMPRTIISNYDVTSAACIRIRALTPGGDVLSNECEVNVYVPPEPT